MTKVGEDVTRPGAKLTKAGLVIAMIGALFTVVVVAAGGNLNPLWLVLIGLVIAGIGFGQRVLAALENR